MILILTRAVETDDFVHWLQCYLMLEVYYGILSAMLLLDFEIRGLKV